MSSEENKNLFERLVELGLVNGVRVRFERKQSFRDGKYKVADAKFEGYDKDGNAIFQGVRAMSYIGIAEDSDDLVIRVAQLESGGQIILNSIWLLETHRGNDIGKNDITWFVVDNEDCVTSDALAY